MTRALQALATLLLLTPLGLTVWLAFSPDAFFTLPVGEWSARWFGQALSQDHWREALVRSAWMAALAGALATALAVAGALSTPSDKGWMLVLLPACIPQVAWAMGLLPLTAFLPGGASTGVLVLAQAALGLPVAWLVVRLRVDAGLHGLLATARGLGASPVQSWWRVGLPRLAPALATAFLLSATLAFHEPVLCLFLCPPGQETVPAVAWPTLRSSLTPVVAAVATVTLAAGILITGFAVQVWRGRGP